MDNVLRLTAGVLLFVLTMGFWAFTLLFHVLSDWKSTVMGRHIMSLVASCSLVLGWSWAGFTFDLPESFRAWVRLALYGSLAFVVWRQVRLLIKEQIITRDSQKPEEPTNGHVA